MPKCRTCRSRVLCRRRRAPRCSCWSAACSQRASARRDAGRAWIGRAASSPCSLVRQKKTTMFKTITSAKALSVARESVERRGERAQRGQHLRLDARVVLDELRSSSVVRHLTSLRVRAGRSAARSRAFGGVGVRGVRGGQRRSTASAESRQRSAGGSWSVGGRLREVLCEKFGRVWISAFKPGRPSLSPSFIGG